MLSLARKATMMNRVSGFFRHVSEMILPDEWFNMSWSGVRSGFRSIGLSFWPKTRPTGEGTQVNYDYTRKLYRNSGENGLGGGFAKPIVNLQVGFLGLPRVSTDDEALDEFLNDCISIYWTSEIQDMFRDSLRDSKCIVRMRPLDILDPLMTMEEKKHGAIEILPPERVDIEYNMRNKNIIEQAVIRHKMVIVTNSGSVTEGRDPITEEHDILEIIDRENYRFWDLTTNEWITGMQGTNSANFVPLFECYNEWDAALQGGQSEFESVIPFIDAFHEVMTQGLQAHKYHSTPKLKMKLVDLGPFVKNNFPNAWDEARGDVIPGSEISLNGREIMFFRDEEDATFLEARSVLGDTKSLLEFLIDCICIASETPEWAFMRVDSGSANSDRNAQTVPFVKKIERKRRQFNKYVQQLCKMAIVMSGENSGIPIRAKVSWGVTRPDDQFVTMQAFQQLVMGLEVARERGEITDDTYRRAIREFLPHMLPSDEEGKKAEKETEAKPEPKALPVVAGPQGANE
jgi:hypothetical protein